jgi:hypothetical protein
LKRKEIDKLAEAIESIDYELVELEPIVMTGTCSCDALIGYKLRILPIIGKKETKNNDEK